MFTIHLWEQRALPEIIRNYRQQLADNSCGGGMYGREALEFTFRFFAPYDKLILGIENSGSFHLITDSVNALLRNDYKDHFTAGAIMQVYMHWIHTHKKESPEEIARICYPMIAGHHY